MQIAWNTTKYWLKRYFPDSYYKKLLCGRHLITVMHSFGINTEGYSSTIQQTNESTNQETDRQTDRQTQQTQG